MKQEDKSKFSWRARGRSFKYAGRGVFDVVRFEHNFRIHLSLAALALILAFLLGLSTIEWCVIILCIGMVLAAELINSAIESLADKISPEYDELIKLSKNYGAAAVFVLSIMAFVIGVIIFFPKFYILLIS